MTPLIFVYDGILPDYCFYSLDLAIKYSNKKIILLATKDNKKIPKNIDCYFIEDFYEEKLSKKIKLLNQHEKFWNGFWVKTIERFFILESFCKKYNFNSFFHAELDNLIFDIESLDKKLDRIGRKFFFTKDRPHRGLAGLIYINSTNILTDFCNFVLENLKENFLNDMELLGKFSNSHSEKCIILPNELDAFQTDKILFNAIDISTIDGIFDGARIGTFLFGVDPRISKGPVFNRIQPKGDDNKTNFNYNNLLFYFSSFKKEFIIKDKKTNKSFKIFNLHIHSKLFKKLSDEKKFILILNRMNLNQSSLMTFNLKNILKRTLNSIKSKVKKILQTKQ